MQNTINHGIKIRVTNIMSHDGKYLTFMLCGEKYGIKILKVREIIGIMNIMPVPQAPQYMKGVINFRGKLVPVIDLRLRFGLQEKDYPKEQCIIILEDKDKLAGIIVDTVSEVLDVHGEELQPASSLRGGIKDEIFLGMAKIKNKMKILLDIDRIVNDEEIHVVKSLTRVR